MRLGLISALLLGFIASALSLALDSVPFGALRERSDLHAGFFHVKIPMRDGVKLSTVIILPLTNQTTYAASMVRSPYGHMAMELLPCLFLSYGYAAIGQDVRGTGESEGEFSAWRSDADDAYDTMEWLTKQKWSNGKIYQFGLSADGISTFVIATNPHPALAGQTMIFATGETYDTIYQGGAYIRGLVEKWIRKTVRSTEVQTKLLKAFEANEQPSEWWDSINITNARWGNFKNPSVVWAGWGEIFGNGAVRGFNKLQKYSAPAVRGESYLVVDPLGHCQSASGYFRPNLIFGRALLSIQLAMWNLGSRSSPVPQGVDKVTFYVMTKNALLGPGNYWTSLPQWPDYKPEPLYLADDNKLAFTAGEANNMTYSFDPKNPVPTRGGANLFEACGPLDQATVDRRADVLLFTSPELTEDYPIVGPVALALWVSSANVNDTDYTAKLEHVSPGGDVALVTDGIIRMRWRNGQYGGALPQWIERHKVYYVEVDLGETAYIFPKGHKIRLAVSSSNSPRFDVNQNNGLPLSISRSAPPVTAINTVYFGGIQRSALIMPRVTKAQIPRKAIGTELGPEAAEACRMLAKLPQPLSQYTMMGDSSMMEAFQELCSVNNLFF